MVVIGILIALQVNNWNEERKLNTERQTLIASMHSDFITTRARLDQSLIQVNDIIGRLENLLSVAYKTTPTIPADSLRYWAGAAYELAQVEPILTSYNEALPSIRYSVYNRALSNNHPWEATTLCKIIIIRDNGIRIFASFGILTDRQG